MNIETLRDFCLSFKGITEEQPFGPDNLVYKVKGKMFALVSLDPENLVINLKNLPEVNQDLRAENDFITGAYHMNKTHWNSVKIDFRVKTELIKKLISESYLIVASGLPKKIKEELDGLI